MNGTNMIKLISNEVFSSLIIYAGAISQIDSSSGDFGFVWCASSTKNVKSLSLVCFNINSFNGFEPSFSFITKLSTPIDWKQSKKYL